MDIQEIIPKVMELASSGKIDMSLLANKDVDGLAKVLKENGIDVDASQISGLVDAASQAGIDPSSLDADAIQGIVGKLGNLF